MAQSGVTVNPECISAFNELKLGKTLRYIIFKISDDWKEIVVEDTYKIASESGKSDEDIYAGFRQKLLDAKSKNKKGEEGIGGRYAVYDVGYDIEGEGQRNKITFFSWVPDVAPMYPRMMYSSSKEALKRSLNGLAADVQANEADDIEYDTILTKVRKF